MEINILGLRDLKPALGWVPVNKAFISFDLSSLEMPGEGRNVRNVQTQPGEPGPNPNLNAIIKFTCQLPHDPLYSPALSCSVFDCLFMGMSQPLLGSFSINLGEIYHEKRGFSGPELIGEPLLRAKTIVQHDPFSKDSPSFSDSESSTAAVSIFARNGPAQTAQNSYLEKANKVPPPPVTAGVRRGETERMREDLPLELARLGQFVRTPKIERNPRSGRIEEQNPPDENYYMQIGYDRVPGEGTMHYRYIVKGELEKSKYLDESPFDQFNIIRGQQVGCDSYFDLHPDKSHVEFVGKFKGLIRIQPVGQAEERRRRREDINRRKTELQGKIAAAKELQLGGRDYSQEMEELMKEDEDEQFDNIARRLLSPIRVLVRVYILDAFSLAQRDIGSQSDPYVRIKLGSKVWHNEKENYQLDNPDPKIFKMFELETTLPGVSDLKIQFWDYDDVFSDDKIGQTVIDLEDRFFSQKWQSLKEKPIETRPLFIKTTKVPQGGVRMWLEMVPISERSALKVRDITQRPPAEYEARLIIWGTEGVANYDDEGTSDIYIRAWVNDCKPKETDTHFRCMTGRGSFNYRMKFPLTLTEKMSNKVTLQIWDRDILSKNDFIADATLTFDATAKQAWESGGRISRKGDSGNTFSRGESDKFWIDCMRRRADGKMVHGGRVQVSLELVPAQQAQACPVGEGRSEPNLDPFLPPPVGRFSWTWNPCKLIQQTVGPEYQCKAVLFCCLALCLMMCVFMFPVILSNAITTAAFG